MLKRQWQSTGWLKPIGIHWKEKRIRWLGLHLFVDVAKDKGTWSKILLNKGQDDNYKSRTSLHPELTERMKLLTVRTYLARRALLERHSFQV